jgi:predicted MFS family arabinose efflux permease
VPLAALIARWFEKRRGLMSGIAISGFGFGLMAVPPLATRITGWFDWRTAMLIVGIADLLLIVALARFLKDQSKQYATVFSGAAAENIRPGLHNITFREAIKTRQLWMIAAAWFFYGIFYYVSTVHIVRHATDLGMTALDAASLLTIIGITGVVGRISLGFGGDRIGNKTVVIISFAFLTAAYTGLLLSGSHGMLLVFAVAYGLFHGIGIIAATLAAEYFGLKSVGIITGVMVFANSMGGAAGPVIAGRIFDATKSYNAAFLLCAVLGAASCVIMVLLKPARR